MNPTRHPQGGTRVRRCSHLRFLTWPADGGRDKPVAAEVSKPQPESTKRMIARLAGISREVDPFIVPYFAGRTVR